MIRFVGLGLIGLILLAGCHKLQHEVDLARLNNEAAKLVVTCFLSPQDQVLAVKVTRTKSIVGQHQGASNDTDVVDATVQLSEGGRSVRLVYDAGQAYYRADVQKLPVIVGRTYALRVQTPANEQVTGFCTIPGPVPLACATFDSLTEGQVQRYFVRVQWQDLPAQTNFYQITGLFRYVTNCPTCEKNPTYQAREEAAYLHFDNLEGTLVNDYSHAGGTLISEPAFLNSTANGNDPQPGFRSQYKAATVVVNLLNIDRNYYQYQNAVVRQAESKNNPFAEPVLILSNLQGGLGCFGAYNRSTLTMELK